MIFETRTDIGKWASTMIAEDAARASAIAAEGYPFAAYDILTNAAEAIRAKLQDLAERRATPPQAGEE